MGIFKGRRVVKVTEATLPEHLVKVIVTFNSVASPAAAFADMKYNKNSGLICVKDDGTITDGNTVLPIMHGGLAVDGITYPGYRYGDGCGNLVEPHYTFAINTSGQRDTQTQTNTTWATYIQAAQWGHQLANHSRDHGGYNKYYQIKDAEKTIFNKTGQRVRAFVIPTADEGYSESAPYLGYKMVGSAFGVNSADDNNKTSNQNIVGNSRINVTTINMQRINKFLFDRFFYNNGSRATSIDQIKKLIDWTLEESVGGVKKMGHWFSHGVGVDGSNATYVEMFDYIWDHPLNNDTMWFPTMQEFSEYYETKLLSQVTQELDGVTLTLTIDLSAIPPENFSRDMSILISGGSINNILVLGADSSTQNVNTGLVNIFKKNKSVKSPALDPIPPEIVSVTKSGNVVTVNFSREITQSVFSSVYGPAYTISGNNISSITGSGATWFITCNSPVATNATLDYRMQRGNAQDLNGLKVCSYIGFPIT